MAGTIAGSEGTHHSSRSVGRALVAPTLLLVAVASSIAGLAANLATIGAPPDFRSEPIASIATFVLLATFTVVGVVLQRRHAVDSLGDLFLAFAAAGGVTSVLYGLALVEGRPGGDASLGRTLAWIGGAVTLPAWTYLITALIVRFPSGRPDTRRDARLLRVAALACTISGILAAVRPGPLVGLPMYDNPIDALTPMRGVIEPATNVAILLSLLPALAVTWGMIERYQRAPAVARLQLRWFAYAGVLTLAGGSLYLVVGVLLAPESHVIRELTFTAFVIAACSMPIAVLEAITRHHLYEIDRIIGRTFIYGALTAILAGVYSAAIRLFNAVFVGLTGAEDEAALVLTTLVLATTFTPIKSRLEKIAEKRFKTVERAAMAGGEGDGPGPAAKAGTAVSSADVDLAGLDERIEAVVRRVLPDVLEEARHRRSR